MTATLQQRIRQELGTLVDPGYPKPLLSLRRIARESGIPVATLSRFLKDGSMTGANLDKLDAYLEGVARNSQSTESVSSG